jgi:uncharacterized protein
MAIVAHIKDINLVESEIRAFYSRIRERFPVRKMLLFGSYARNCPTPDSDIDVGVVIDLPKNADKIEITAELFHFSRTIDILIEPYCILWEDYLHCEPASILAEIIRTGVEVVSVPDAE